MEFIAKTNPLGRLGLGIGIFRAFSEICFIQDDFGFEMDVVTCGISWPPPKARKGTSCLLACLFLQGFRFRIQDLNFR